MLASPVSVGGASAARAAESQLARLDGRGIRLGTETVRATLAALGDPQRAVPTVVVTGTNGKGSTATMLAQILAAAGHTVGVFTSPALERIHEQISLRAPAATPTAVAIDDDTLADALTRTINAAETRMPGRITAFEALAVSAMLHFAERGLEWAVLEAGLGGASDACGAAEPQASVLVSVGLDHADFLGHDLSAIAREKAGTFRRDQPAVIGWLETEALAAALAAAKACGAPIRSAATHVVDLTHTAHGLAPQHVHFETLQASYDFRLPLLGAHQARNAALAILTAEALADTGAFAIDPHRCAVALAACRWPGRLEAIVLAPETSSRVGPSSGTTTLLVDAAHNAASAEALATFLRHLDRPFSLVFGAFRDKDAEAMLGTLVPHAARVHLAPVAGARTFDPRDVQTLAPEARIHGSIGDALTAALGAPVADDPLIVACGSLRVIADAYAFVAALHRGSPNP